MGEREPGGDMAEVADAFAAQAGTYLSTVSQVASGLAPEAALPLLLLATSDVLAAGARLGAMVDVVPGHRFEPDSGPDTDLDPLQVGLARVLEGLDGYPEVVDPVLSAELGEASVSGDLTAVAGALTQGLAHFEAGHRLEALWWWQYSYLASWGERASASLRVLQLTLAHLRLDVAAEAEYDALQARSAD